MSHAPYNFVPFYPGVLIRYGSPEALPGHDRLDPALKTGEIHLTLRAETPVFVSDGNRNSPRFFRGASGRFLLPGSTVRGMVRENMQILGFGLVRPGEDLDDCQLFFRKIASSNRDTGTALKKYYHDVLGIKSARGREGAAFSLPQNVKAGYLRRDGDRLLIQPVRGGGCIRVSRKNRALQASGLANGAAKTVPVVYRARGGALKYIQRGSDPGPGLERGVLLYTGRGIGRPGTPKSRNARYLFPAADAQADPVVISPEDELSYRVDLEDRFNSLKAYYDPGFWALPESGEEKPVFYVRYNGHTYFGMSLFLRIGYRHSLAEGLPPRHKELLASGSDPLDYVHAMLGFAGRESACRSRVSFGDFPALGAPAELPPVSTVLGQPKPGWYPGYTEGGKHYSEEDFRLRGYKQYWLKEPQLAPAGRENVASTLRPLPPGTEFRGVIRYKNLHEDELGLLLWALRLEDGCYQSIGMGKPCGFGRMKLTIDRLLEFDPARLYAPDGLCAGPTPAPAGTVERCIAAYDAYAAGELSLPKPQLSIRSLACIQDFFYIRSVIRSGVEVEYMPLSQYKNALSGLPTIREVRARAEAAQQAQNAAPPTAAARRRATAQ